MSFERWVLGAMLALAFGCTPAPPPTGSVPPAPQATAASAATSPAPATSAAPSPTSEPTTTPAASAAPASSATPAASATSAASATPASATAPAQGAPKPAGKLAGEISQAEIRDLILKHGELFDACYQVGAGGSKSYKAIVTVKATIGPSGSVKSTEVVRSTSKDKKVDACVVEAFKKIPFPPPKGGVTSVITFPIEFAGVEEATD